MSRSLARVERALAVAGLPLGNGRRHADVVMENLIGDDIDRLPDWLD